MLARYDSPQTVFYLDPPYPGNGVNYEHNMRSWEEHEELLEALLSLKGRWILSGYAEHKEVFLNALPGARAKEIAFYSGMAAPDEEGGETRSLNRELLVFNFEEPPGFAALFAEPVPLFQ